MSDIMAIVNQAMNADAERLRSIGQNLANVNTESYKREVVTQQFDRMMVEKNESRVGLYSTGSDSALHPKVMRDLSQGVLKQTNNLMDIALNGQGFLQVEKSGDTYFTRKGHLAVDENGVLSLTTGEKILGIGGNIYLDGTNVEIDTEGSLIQSGVDIGQLAVVHFENADELDYVGEGLFKQRDAQISVSGNTRVKQGFIEVSNVDSLTEMTALIEATRHFEASSQVLKGYDSMLDSAINTLADF
ncbi:hypothetical protein A9Q99_08155 [Gammaproteobacteria bacterium 45_16_T64]|nr:hypothetical protein A9Q99_08155 [Gammaproteobacteria bacterium 45_16_T64]